MQAVDESNDLKRRKGGGHSPLSKIASHMHLYVTGCSFSYIIFYAVVTYVA